MRKRSIFLLPIVESGVAKFIFSILFTALIFIILILKIDFGILVDTLRSLRLKYLWLAIAISFSANIFLAADKWRRILKALGAQLSFKETFFVVLSAKPIKFILPFKSGELIKVLYIAKKGYLHFGKSFASVLFDKVLNITSCLLLLCIGLIFSILNFPIEITLPSILGSSLIFGIRGNPSPLLNFFKRLHQEIAKFVLHLFKIPHRLRRGFLNILFLRGYSALRKGVGFIKQIINSLKEIGLMKKIKFLIYSTFIQLSPLINAYILFKAFDIDVPFCSILLFMPIVVLVSSLPITLSGLGIRESTLLFLFSRYGPKETLLSVGILLSFVEYILPATLGLLSLRFFLERIQKFIPLGIKELS